MKRLVITVIAMMLGVWCCGCGSETENTAAEEAAVAGEKIILSEDSAKDFSAEKETVSDAAHIPDGYSVTEYKDGYVIVKKNGSSAYGVYDFRNNRFVLEDQYDDIGFMSTGNGILFSARHINSYDVYDKNGQRLASGGIGFGCVESTKDDAPAFYLKKNWTELTMFDFYGKELYTVDMTSYVPDAAYINFEMIDGRYGSVYGGSNTGDQAYIILDTFTGEVIRNFQGCIITGMKGVQGNLYQAYLMYDSNSFSRLQFNLDTEEISVGKKVTYQEMTGENINNPVSPAKEQHPDNPMGQYFYLGDNVIYSKGGYYFYENAADNTPVYEDHYTDLYSHSGCYMLITLQGKILLVLQNGRYIYDGDFEFNKESKHLCYKGSGVDDRLYSDGKTMIIVQKDNTVLVFDSI